jgi:hypothetical protein
MNKFTIQFGHNDWVWLLLANFFDLVEISLRLPVSSALPNLGETGNHRFHPDCLNFLIFHGDKSVNSYMNEITLMYHTLWLVSARDRRYRSKHP